LERYSLHIKNFQFCNTFGIAKNSDARIANVSDAHIANISDAHIANICDACITNICDTAYIFPPYLCRKFEQMEISQKKTNSISNK